MVLRERKDNSARLLKKHNWKSHPRVNTMTLQEQTLMIITPPYCGYILSKSWFVCRSALI